MNFSNITTIPELITRLGINPKYINILNNEQFDLDSLKYATDDDLIELKFSKGARILLRTWRQSFMPKQSVPPRVSPPRVSPPRPNNLTRVSPLRPNNLTRVSPPRPNNLTRVSPRQSVSPRNRTLNARNRNVNQAPPPLFRQSTVSETLLTELVDNVQNRKLLDSLIFESTRDLVYKDIPLVLEEYTRKKHKFLSKITTHNSQKHIYYNWYTGGINVCHISLHNDSSNEYHNRTSFARDTKGAFHINMGPLDVKHQNKGRRILVNLINDVYEISICTKGHGFIDVISTRVAGALVEYYRTTGRDSNIVDGRC